VYWSASPWYMGHPDDRETITKYYSCSYAAGAANRARRRL
jgi:hypothetical protein